jgi:hypothetical protein
MQPIAAALVWWTILIISVDAKMKTSAAEAEAVERKQFFGIIKEVRLRKRNALRCIRGVLEGDWKTYPHMPRGIPRGQPVLSVYPSWGMKAFI